jgi:outer membrane receptor protein involved in Fe transport
VNQFDTANRVSPQTNTRVRGLTAADNTRNFFLTRTPWDGYNVDRVDISRGANSILFGIGSPAGIVNTNVQGASLFNEGKIETKIGSYGTMRGSVNVNRVLLDGELAVRVAGLYENEKFRQKPAFDKDERVYAAVRYDPKWAEIGGTKLSIKLNYENGDIEANRPRINPPTDRITPWFTHMNQATFDGSIINSSNRTEYETSYLGNPSYGALQATFGDGTPNPNYQPYAAYWGGQLLRPRGCLR